MGLIHVDSLQATELDEYLRLTDHELRNSLDPARGILICESEIAISVALECGVAVRSVLINEARYEHMKPLIEQLPLETPVYLVPGELAEQITGYPVTRGVLASMMRPTAPSLDEILSSSKRICVLEGIVDTANVGGIIRSAAALGIDSVVCASNCCDIYARRCVRVSMGNVFRLPCVRLQDARPDILFRGLQAHDYTSVSMALSPEAKRLQDIPLASYEKLAIILGNETKGLSQATLESSDLIAEIPMAKGTDSLNVGVAAALAFWEATKS